MNDSAATILVVDDNPLGQEAVEGALAGQGYHLVFAASGADALAEAARLTPDLILLDVMMPDMDGFEVCQRLRAAPALAEAPIILLTALDDRASRLRGLEAGADEFLSKPFDRAELRARARTITRLNRYRNLWAERARLEQLTRRLVEVQEAERRFLAAELHDELGQSLTGLKLMLETSAALPEAELRARLKEAQGLTREVLRRVRELSLDLRPAMLDDVGLFAAVDWLCERFERQTSIRIDRQFDPFETRRFRPEIEIAAFRIAQEALTNLARYAGVPQAEVALSADDAALHLTVRDRGAGFDPARPKSTARLSSGLTGMTERARSVDGQVAITSAPGHGTTVSAALPLAPPRPEG